VGTLPKGQRCNPDRLNADTELLRVSFGPAAKRSPGDSTSVKPRASLKSIFYGFHGYNSSIEDTGHINGRDRLLNQTPFKFSTARSCPGKGDCRPVTFFDCLHITHNPVGTTGYVLFPLNAHETWMIVEPFACNRPRRSTALQAGATIARQR
jgi:hypothetical protein